MGTLGTVQTPARAIRSYMEAEDIRFRRLVTALGIRKDVLSRMLSDAGRYQGERLTAELIRQIADVLKVDRDVEKEWLALLESDRQPVAVA